MLGLEDDGVGLSRRVESMNDFGAKCQCYSAQGLTTKMRPDFRLCSVRQEDHAAPVFDVDNLLNAIIIDAHILSSG